MRTRRNNLAKSFNNVAVSPSLKAQKQKSTVVTLKTELGIRQNEIYEKCKQRCHFNGGEFSGIHVQTC